jgi:hypothetical protein
MKLSKARAAAKELFLKHHLFCKHPLTFCKNKQWKVNFKSLGMSRKKLRPFEIPMLGATSYGEKTIILDSYAVKRMTVEEFNIVFLHELAHALLPSEASNGGHTKKWEELVVKIGGTTDVSINSLNWRKRKITK